MSFVEFMDTTAAKREVIMFFYAPKCQKSLMIKPSILIASLMTEPAKLIFAAIDCTMSGNFCAERGVISDAYPQLRHYDSMGQFKTIPIDFANPLQLVQFVAKKLGKKITPKLREEVLDITQTMQKKEAAAAETEAENELLERKRGREDRVTYLQNRNSKQQDLVFLVASGTEVTEETSWLTLRKRTRSSMLVVFYAELDDLQSGVSVSAILPVTALNVTLVVIACDSKDNDRLCDSLNKDMPRSAGELEYPVVRFFKGKEKKGKVYTGKMDQMDLLNFVKKQKKKKKIKL
jgi:hypothetical protein